MENSSKDHFIRKVSRSFTHARNPFLFIFLLGCFLFRLGSQAQYYQSQIIKIRDEQGNSPNATFEVVECNMGFIWFGTIDGLYRYDGYNFKIFRNIPDNLNSLANNTIRSMDLYKDSLLWIATEGGGLDCFNFFTENFTHFKHTGEAENEISGNSLWSVLVDSRGNIWAGVSGKGVDRLDARRIKFTHFNPTGKETHLTQEQTVRSLHEDGNGLIWAGLSDNGFSSINPVSGEVRHYKRDLQSDNTLNCDWVYDISVGSDNKLWLVTFGGGINIFDPIREEYDYLRHKKGVENSLISDLSYSMDERFPGEYWIGTEYGISQYKAETGQFISYQKNEISGRGLSENRIRKLFFDKQGILWAGTESGVDKIVLQSKFEIFQFAAGKDHEMKPGIVRAITEDDQGNLWIGLIDNGLIRYNWEKNAFKQYMHSEHDPYSLSGNNIDVIFQDLDKTIWVGDWNTGLMKYNPINDNFIHVADAYRNKNTLSDNRIQIIRQDKPGVLWIGTEQGINRFDIKNNRYLRYQHEPGNPNSLSGNSIQSRALAFDKQHNLWAGTWSFGLNKIEFLDSTQTTASIRSWQHDPENTESLPNNSVLALHFDIEGMLWIGTFGGGLSCFNPQTEKFRNYTTDDGLPNNIIFAILEDEKQKLWISTDYGISRFDPETGEFRNYTKSDGLQDDHFFWGAAHKGRSGRLYFGGINGVNSFFPEKVIADTHAIKPVLVDIKLFNESIKSDKPVALLKQMEFNYDENFISFEYAALDYSRPSKNRFEYMLEGFDREWINSGNKHEANYTNLSHGQYIFRLVAYNSDGFRSNHELTFTLIINPPWWKTWLARILFFFTAIALILLIFYLRFKQLSNQKQKLKGMVFERTNELHELNTILEERQEKIESQNEELSLHRTKLEKLVEERTQDLEEALKKAEEADRLKSSFLANMSHEVRTPMNAIVGFAQLIKEEDLDKKERNEYIDIIHNNCQSLLVIINDILDISIIEADQLVVNKQPFDIDKMFTELVNYYLLKATRDLRIEYICPGGCREFIITHDMIRIKQVLQNLIDNAIKFTESGHVRFGYRIEHNTIDFFVEDTGIGIHQEDYAKVFAPFTKAEYPETKIYRGAGLGLAICRKIAERLQGSLTFSSEWGKGTTFHFLLPLH